VDDDLFDNDGLDNDDDRYDQEGPGLLDLTPPPPAVATGVPKRAPRTKAAKPAEPAGPAMLAETPEAAKPADEALPLALYRRYRPDTFAEVIGQEHVTEPLQRALTNNKVHHAYLFSGPRGCGKTSSARILARCLNCEQGPTATPCGVCQSCRDLATGGPGSIDVVEMDAATHGLVDDTRELRERAFFMPVQSRFRVYIIDEAHMVTPQGFNALLKLVEEPPPHVKFIFATTEPDKVLPTIRSRTHHYPFRLVPQKTMQAYLLKICDEEGVKVEPGVLPLVVRAGAGSVRDSLSVLDQLIGSADGDVVTTENTTQLLGFTPAALLDQIMDALGTSDGAALFGTIDRVIESGQDPRHFAADLLQRLRDVLVVATVPDALSSGLIDVAADQGDRLQEQATAMGQPRLTHAAEVIARGLTGMRGTTAPRLHLELMCAQAMLPAEDFGALASRVERIERRLVGAVPAAPVGAMADAPASPSRARFADAAPASEPPPQQRQSEPSRPPLGQRPAPAPTAAPARPVPTPPPTAPAPVAAPAPAGGHTLASLRQAWPAVLDRVKQDRRYAWMLLSNNSELIDAQGDTITLGFTNTGARESFMSGGTGNVLASALAAVTNSHWRINAIMAGTEPQPNRTPPVDARPPATRPPAARPLAPQTVYAEDDSVNSAEPLDSEVSPDDEDIIDGDTAALLSSALGAELIAEEEEDV